MALTESIFHNQKLGLVRCLPYCDDSYVRMMRRINIQWILTVCVKPLIPGHHYVLAAADDPANHNLESVLQIHYRYEVEDLSSIPPQTRCGYATILTDSFSAMRVSPLLAGSMIHVPGTQLKLIEWERALVVHRKIILDELNIEYA